MAKTYICRDNSGAQSKPSSPQSSGAHMHLLYKGATFGYVYDYSGAVTGSVLYVVDNGPTLGRQYSAS